MKGMLDRFSAEVVKFRWALFGACEQMARDHGGYRGGDNEKIWELVDHHAGLSKQYMDGYKPSDEEKYCVSDPTITPSEIYTDLMRRLDEDPEMTMDAYHHDHQLSTFASMRWSNGVEDKLPEVKTVADAAKWLESQGAKRFIKVSDLRQAIEGMRDDAAVELVGGTLRFSYGIIEAKKDYFGYTLRIVADPEMEVRQRP